MLMKPQKGLSHTSGGLNILNFFVSLIAIVVNIMRYSFLGTEQHTSKGLYHCLLMVLFLVEHSKMFAKLKLILSVSS
jgi:hypothetical protein